jgi:hypothetical protein
LSRRRIVERRDEGGRCGIALANFEADGALRDGRQHLLDGDRRRNPLLKTESLQPGNGEKSGFG